MRIAINKGYGAFNLNWQAYKELGIEFDDTSYLCNEFFGIKSDYWLAWRADERLIKAIEKFGDDLNVKVVEIPDDVQWYIEDCDGLECVCEKHRIWR